MIGPLRPLRQLGEWWQRRSAARLPIDAAQWCTAEDALPFLDRLSDMDRSRLRDLARRFIAAKEWNCAGGLTLTPAIPPIVAVMQKTTDVTVAGVSERDGYTFGIDNRTDRLIDIRHAGKRWCMTPDDESSAVVSRAIGALVAAHADIGTALTRQIAR